MKRLALALAATVALGAGLSLAGPSSGPYTPPGGNSGITSPLSVRRVILDTAQVLSTANILYVEDKNRTKKIVDNFAASDSNTGDLMRWLTSTSTDNSNSTGVSPSDNLRFGYSGGTGITWRGAGTLNQNSAEIDSDNGYNLRLHTGAGAGDNADAIKLYLGGTLYGLLQRPAGVVSFDLTSKLSTTGDITEANAGASGSTEVFRANDAGGDPYLLLGATNVANSAFFQFARSASLARYGALNASGQVTATVDLASAGDATINVPATKKLHLTYGFIPGTTAATDMLVLDANASPKTATMTGDVLASGTLKGNTVRPYSGSALALTSETGGAVNLQVNGVTGAALASTGVFSTVNGIIIGNGANLTNSFEGSFSVTFGLHGPLDQVDSGNQTLTGAATGDACAVGAPATHVGGTTYECRVTAANTIRIDSMCVNGAAGTCDESAAQTFRVRTFGH